MYRRGRGHGPRAAFSDPLRPPQPFDEECDIESMLPEAVVQSLPMSLGVALSPLPVAAVVIMLMTARARVNAPAFLCGWILGILAVGTLVFLVPGIRANPPEPTATGGAVQIGLGVAFLLLAGRNWRRRPVPGEPTRESRVLSMLEQIGPWHSLGTGFGFSAINPKNLLLVLAGAAALASTTADPSERGGALLVFAAIASTTVAAPVAACLLARRQVEPLLDRCKTWLVANNVAVVVAVLLSFGALMLARGLRILASP